MNVESGYESLAEVLQEALDQAQSGKGKERHANADPFESQEICDGARKCGVGAMVYQARKKSLEALRLKEKHGVERALPDLYGAINYLAAAIIVMKEDQEVALECKEEEGVKLRDLVSPHEWPEWAVALTQDKDRELWFHGPQFAPMLRSDGYWDDSGCVKNWRKAPVLAENWEKPLFKRPVI